MSQTNNNPLQGGAYYSDFLKGSGFMGREFNNPATTDMGMERYRERMGLNRPVMDMYPPSRSAVMRPAVMTARLFKAPELAKGLVDDLHEAGLAGSGSHKAQYVRWMLGRVRGNRTGDVYRNPYAKDDKRKPVASSNPKDTPYAGWSPDDWDGKFSPFDPHKVNGELVSPFIQNMKKKRVFKIKPKAKAPRNEVVEAPPAPAEKFPKGQKLTQRELDEAIIHLYQRDKLTTRAIVKKLKDDYDLTTSQPTVARRIKAFNDGVIDATGKRL